MGLFNTIKFYNQVVVMVALFLVCAVAVLTPAYSISATPMDSGAEVKMSSGEDATVREEASNDIKNPHEPDFEKEAGIADTAGTEKDNSGDFEPGSPSPMVSHHIFSPLPDSETDSTRDITDTPEETLSREDDRLLERAQKDLTLTGIVITPLSSRALIAPGSKKKSADAPAYFQKGAVVDGYLLKDIFPNYIIVSLDNKEVKLGLYRERRDRPAPQKGVTQEVGQPLKNIKDMAAEKIRKARGNKPFTNNAGGVVPDGEENPAYQDDSLDNSFQNDENPSSMDSGDVDNSVPGIGGSGNPNPFLQAIQKARGLDKKTD